MYIDVVFSPQEFYSRGEISSKSVAVIDVLRATSTIAYAFWGFRENDIDQVLGCSKIIPVETLEEAVELSKKFNRDEILLAGERYCLKPDGFDLGNSPCEYTPERIQGKTIIFSTTNGTRALKLAQGAHFVTTAAIVNVSACADVLFEKQNDVIILCAGRSDKTTSEDTLCAGILTDMLIQRCRENNQDYDLSDAADIAIKYMDHYKHDILKALKNAEAGRNLVHVDLERDLDHCALVDLLAITTEYKNGYLTAKAIQK